MLILGRVGLGHFTCGSGWVESRKLNQRPTLSLNATKGKGTSYLIQGLEHEQITVSKLSTHSLLKS